MPGTETLLWLGVGAGAAWILGMIAALITVGAIISVRERSMSDMLFGGLTAATVLAAITLLACASKLWRIAQ